MTPLRRYYRGHSLVAMRDVQANQTRYYHADHQGTTQALTDGTGAVTDRFASDAWGVQVKRTGSSINRQWYVGQLGYYRQLDQALDYVRARYLDVARGRWASRDRLRTAQRSYTYAGNNPPVAVDPTGLRCAYPWRDCISCGGVLPCPNKPPAHAVECHPALPPGCQAMDSCPDVKCTLQDATKQIAALWLRLHDVAIDPMGRAKACRLGGQPTGGEQNPAYAFTFCCGELGEGCDSRTLCLVCPGQAFGWDRLRSENDLSCLLVCLLAHEADHARQCHENYYSPHDDATDLHAPECKPWGVECSCLAAKVWDVVETTSSNEKLGKEVDQECCKSRKDFVTAACKAKMKELEKLVNHFLP
jgi:RHS repeat-associated protein